MKEDKLSDLSMQLSVDVLNLVKELRHRKETIISNQIGRSATSVCANIAESKYGHSRADFIVKLEIAKHRKEFWQEVVYEFETEKVEHNIIDVVVHYNGLDYTTIETQDLNENANGLIFFKNFDDAKIALIERIKKNIDYLKVDNPNYGLKLESYKNTLKIAMELKVSDVHWG